MELKLCPFCGSEAKTANILGRFGIQCPECFASMRAGMYEEDASIIKAWNTRPEQNKKLIEAVKECKSTIIKLQNMLVSETNFKDLPADLLVMELESIISEIEGE